MELFIMNYSKEPIYVNNVRLRFLFTGLPAQKPEFMESHIKKRKHTVPNSDSDEEWKPSSEKTKRNPG